MEADAPPPPIVLRTATDLPPEDLQAEFLRYAIPAGDVASRVHALQRMYNDEYETSQREYEEYLKHQQMKQIKQEYDAAVQEMKELERRALARDDKTTTIIAANATPKHLVIRSLSPLACCALLRTMRTNTNVVTLDLSNNHLSDVISDSLGKMLQKNKRLRGLHLGFNTLTSAALDPLGKALQRNTVLTSLSIESNPTMANTNAPSTASSQGHTATSSSDGSSNSQSKTLAAFDSFFRAVETNSTLTSLNLFNTQMSFDVGRALARALTSNSTLQALEVGGNSISQNDLATITKALQRNQQIQAQAQDKNALLCQTIRQSAAKIHETHINEAKQVANTQWHDANAKERADQREKDEWHRARCLAEDEIRVAMEIEAQQKVYLQQIEDKKNAKPSKGKK